MVPAIELDAVVKDYPVGRGLGEALRAPFTRPWRRVLHGVSLTVQPGEVQVLLGPNGSGKSTCLLLLAGLVRPTAGHARVNGIDTAAEPVRAQRGIGHVNCDDRGFYWRLDVRENLRFFAALRGLHGAEFADRLTDLVGPLGLDKLLDAPFRNLSAGQRARVALARGLLHGPRTLLLDEVTRSLDPGAAVRLRRLVVEELAGKRGIGVLFTTHDLPEAETIATRVALLVDGRIVADGSYASVRPAIDETFFAGEDD